ncbi:hypothetical protein lbkm_3958 [Lachnospiraceae bacterium KM106-2]|nr:hypothetical protein lbkm_3958 [Lachnospiraceae bacterium KM106-2]
MKVIMYGTLICEDCVEALKVLEEKKIDVDFRDFNEKTENIKGFLKYRDELAMFDEIKKENKIGIPCFVLEDETITLDVEEVMKKAECE